MRINVLQYRSKKFKHNIFKYILLLITSISLSTCIYYFQLLNNLYDTLVNLTGAHIKTLIVIGASPKVEKLIKANLGVKEGDSIFKLSTTKLLNNLMNIGWIKDVSIHKILPNIIKIEVKERAPIAIYYHNKTYTLIDKDGNFIEDVKENPNLPLVSGTDANVNINKMLEILSKYPSIRNELHSIVYVRQRRWDIILNNKITVKLPSCNDELINNSLNILDKLLKQPNIQNSVVSIDLRIPNNVIITGLHIITPQKQSQNK